MHDATMFPWEGVRNYHGIVLRLMEHDEVSWTDKPLIQELRAQYARTPGPAFRVSKRGVHTGKWSWVAPRRPCCAHLRVVLPSAPAAIPTRWEGLLHQAKMGFKKRRNGFGQLASTDIPALANLDDAGSLLMDLPFAHCDYDDDTELTQATWLSPQEHAPDAPPCPHIAPSRPCHLPEYLCIYDAVRSAGLPNFLGARISLQHNLHFQAWRRYAPFYKDHELPDCLEYRFLLGYMLGNMPTPSQSNHQSARCYPSHVDHYITTELDAFDLCGPFPKPLFDAFQTNPLMTAPKNHSCAVFSHLSCIPHMSRWSVYCRHYWRNIRNMIFHHYVKFNSYSNCTNGTLVTHRFRRPPSWMG